MHTGFPLRGLGRGWPSSGCTLAPHFLPLTGYTLPTNPAVALGSAQNGSWRQERVTTQPLGILRASMGLDRGLMSPVSTQCLWDRALPELNLASNPGYEGKGISWKGCQQPPGYPFSLLLLIVLMEVKPL